MPTAYDFTPRPTVALQNPLDIYGRAAQTANALNEVKAFRAREAAGQAMLDASGPSGIDAAALTRNLQSSGPGVAVAVPAALQAGANLNQTQQTRSAQAQSSVNQGIASLLAMPDSQQNAQTYAAHIDAWTQAGVISPQDAQAAKSDMPQNNDPSAWRQYALRHLIHNMTPPEQVSQVYGTRPAINTGGATVFPTVPPISSGGTPPVVPNTLSPAELAQQVPGPVGQDGQPTFETLGARLQRQGALPGGASPSVGPGRLPAALAPSQAQPPGGTAVPAGQSAAQTAAQTETGGASAKAFQDITDAGTQAQARGAVLDNMLADTTQFTTGPGAATIEKIRAVANRMGMPVDTEKLSASESFNKLAANLASQQGAGSDARLSVAQSGNPHADLSPAGVDLMLRQLRGNEDYLQARAKLGAAYPDTADRRGFEAKIGSKLDPRTFQYDRMTPAQKMTYFKSLGTDKAKNDFIKAHDAASALLPQ